MKNLPLGIQTFELVREKNTLYVDKTEYIHKLVLPNTGYYFLSRPRRFGKSLLLSTLRAFFEGRQDLFEGLWIAEKIENWETYPVLHFDFSVMDYKEQSLQQALIIDLQFKAEDFGIDLSGKVPKTMFKDLLEKLHQKTGKKVVVLIDEYDKAIHDFLDNIKQAKKNRDTLKNFYGIIKGEGAHIRFCFLTGVSRFSKMSIFSELNHLTDITLDKAFAALTGYTQEELEANFQEHLQAVVIDRETTMEELMPIVKKWYNGYSWDGKTFVYNPFSFMNFCREKSFYNYWFDTGTPTFLYKQLHESYKYDFERKEIELNNLMFDNLVDMNPQALLFQTGYLTIRLAENDRYELTSPNFETKKAIAELIKSKNNNF